MEELLATALFDPPKEPPGTFIRALLDTVLGLRISSDRSVVDYGSSQTQQSGLCAAACLVFVVFSWATATVST
jgi:hypothetical protein